MVNGEMNYIFFSVIVDRNIAFFFVALFAFAHALGVEFHKRFPFSTIPNRRQFTPIRSSTPC
jgi:hypothetical protein